jgi:PAS domain-containing protein
MAPPEAELLVLDRYGVVLAGPAELVGASLPARPGRAATAVLERWADGERYLVASSRPRASDNGLDWHTVARMRAGAAHAAAGDLQRLILWAGLVLTLTGLGSGWILATWHARPLNALTVAAQKVAAGDDRVQLPALEDYEEIARLAGALRAMLARLRAQAESLRHGREELRRRVHERTAELVRAQADLELQVADAKLAREEVARTHEQLALALDASGQALWDYDVARDEMFFSAGWSQMLGGPAVPTRAPTRVFLGLEPGPARDNLASALAAALERGEDELRIEHPVVRGDGAVIWMALNARVVERDASGSARRAIGTYRSITGTGNRPARLSVLGAQRRNEG